MSASAAQAPAARLGARRAPTLAHMRAGWALERTSAGRAAPASAGPARGRVSSAARRASAPHAPRELPLLGASADVARGPASRARARRDVSARVSAAAPGSAPASFTGVFPLDSAGVGWDAVELHALTGLAWTFTTPSSTDGRKIVKAASAIANVNVKGSSNWRKEDWEDAARRADVRLLDTFSTLPGMRGFRACWAPNGIALLYVPGVRKFFTVEDVARGVADKKAEKEPGGVQAALVNLCRVKKGFEEQYAIAVDAERAAVAAPLAARDAAERAAGVLEAKERNRKNDEAGASDDGDDDSGDERTTNKNARAASRDDKMASARVYPEASLNAYDAPKSCIARWCMGLGVDAASLHAEFGIGFDFHGPAGSVMRSVVASAANAAGDPLGDQDTSSWAKAEWVEAMEKLGITTRASHAALGALGRSWKVCWVADALELGAPAVFLWVPEKNAYYTLGSLAAATSTANAASEGGAPVAVEAAIRAVVGVAKSTPAPPGLKAALTRDCDFLTLLGRKPKDANAPVSAGTTGGADAARAADEALLSSSGSDDEGFGTLSPSADLDTETRPPAEKDATEDTKAATTKEVRREEETSEDDDDEDDDDHERADHASDDDFVAAAAASVSSDDSYFRPAPELDDFEWADSRDGLRRRPSREDDGSFDPNRDLVNPEMFVDAPMSAPGFEDVPGMEGFVPGDAADVTGQGEFFSRSAGYLSFVDGSWSKEDLAREMGLDRQSPNDPPVTARDFPDLSQSLSTRQTAREDDDVWLESDDSDSDDFKELVPLGLPRDFDTYAPLRLHGCDYLVTKTNDGRLDVRDMMVAFRREDGNFAGEARRVDSSATLSIPPGFYHEVAWTERELKKQEKHVTRDGPTEYNTLVERTTKVYLVAADTPFDEAHAHDRRLDFSRPVVVLDNEGACSVAEVRGARENPGGVLVIRDGELFVESAEALPDWETVCHRWEVDAATAHKEGKGPALHEDFLKEVEDDYVPDDTPEIDTY